MPTGANRGVEVPIGALHSSVGVPLVGVALYARSWALLPVPSADHTIQTTPEPEAVPSEVIIGLPSPYPKPCELWA